jgi:hypothetical protein
VDFLEAFTALETTTALGLVLGATALGIFGLELKQAQHWLRLFEVYFSGHV